MKSPERRPFPEDAGEYLFLGGIVAGIIGLLGNPAALILAAGLLGGGVYLKGAK